jgi:hypothetical protein
MDRRDFLLSTSTTGLLASTSALAATPLITPDTMGARHPKR